MFSAFCRHPQRLMDELILQISILQHSKRNDSFPGGVHVFQSCDKWNASTSEVFFNVAPRLEIGQMIGEMEHSIKLYGIFEEWVLC